MYVIFEMDYGGISLSKYMPKTQKEALSIVLQLGLALAVAEEALLFEHRDLHLDNVLVKKTDKSVAYFRLKGVPIVVDNLGWEVIIIDFSLSKMVLNNTTYFHDLRFSDELFQQQGHAQYELYRVMKKALKNKWDQTLLLTNMQWVTLIGKELFRELEKLGLGKKSPALQKYLYVTERSLSAQEFISLCVDSTNELYDKLFKPK
ncbi:putative serine/threonine-protein kinase haspin-like protein, partial [Stegodyphus mimosarum]